MNANKLPLRLKLGHDSTGSSCSHLILRGLRRAPQHNNLQAIIQLLIIRGNIITERYTRSAGANALITCSP